MKKLAVAISVYDKFDDVKILTDLVRENWKEDVFISVCSSHEDPFTPLKGEKIDQLLKSEPIPYDPKIHNTDRKKRVHIFLRVMDNMRKACRSAMDSGAEYTLHVQADALPLSYPALVSLLDQMKSHGKKAAAPGQGFTFYGHDVPIGSLDEMFFIIDNHYAREIRFWDFELLDYLPHKLSPHGWLAIMVMAKIGLRKFLLFSDYDRFVHWDGRVPDLSPLGPAIPMYFHPEYKFLHLHEAAFTKGLGSHLKAYYLASHGITKGKTVEGYLNRWRIDDGELFERLRAEETRLRAFFRRRGLEKLATKSWGRTFIKLDQLVQEYSSLSPMGKAVWLAGKHWAQIKREIRIWLYDHVFFGNNRFLIYHPDIIWPHRLKDVYKENLVMETSRVPEMNGFFDTGLEGLERKEIV